MCSPNEGTMSSVVFSQKIVPSAIAALEAARKASVSVTVDCQCDGIFIDGHQFSPKPYILGDGHGGHRLQPAGFWNSTPAPVPATILPPPLQHACRPEPFVEAAGR